jgi:LytS/YehU family sensor histidine kinase
MAAELLREGDMIGSIRLEARRDSIPFLSDDRRLLQSLAGSLSIVLDNVRYRVEGLRQREREQQLRWLTGRAELKALRAQINPHFLFNALNSIAGLIRTEPRLADETIEQLAQVFRYTLRNSESEWARLGEEMDFVAAYLRVEKARFGERLQLQFDLDEAAQGSLIPAMTIQPLAENAIKHGVRAVAEGGTVSVRTRVGDGCLIVEVHDSGPGFPPGFSIEEEGEGHGLRNVMERLRGYYGEVARLFWDSGPGGTQVTLHLPHTQVPSGGARVARIDRR